MRPRISDPPDPHPLDFDWRFTDDAVDRIRELLPRDAHTLAVGTPSVARRLEGENRPVTLVDRQPLQGVRNHLAIDVHDHSPLRQAFDYAVIDPPWYPEALRYWLAWTANAVRKNGLILASVWPQYTRPSAPDEFREIFEWIHSWGELILPEITLQYRVPLFEIIASRRGHRRPGSKSPGVGTLFEVRVMSRPSVPEYEIVSGGWTRFVLNSYQLAIRFNGKRRAEQALEKHPLAEGWVWPYVSRRALGRTQIGLWSSENEVAIVNKPDTVCRTLRKAIRSQDSAQFEQVLSSFPQLLEWDIPRPPYWRMAEWQHPQ